MEQNEFSGKGTSYGEGYGSGSNYDGSGAGGAQGDGIGCGRACGFGSIYGDGYSYVTIGGNERMINSNEIVVNGITYVPKSVGGKLNRADTLNGMEYCMVRTNSAGVFAGYIESRTGKEAVLRNARRIWSWKGAASLSQLAVDGTSNPGGCRFPVSVDKVILTEVVEIIPITEKAKKSIDEVPIWQF